MYLYLIMQKLRDKAALLALHSDPVLEGREREKNQISIGEGGGDFIEKKMLKMVRVLMFIFPYIGLDKAFRLDRYIS